jgi:hypothetical protein
MKKSDVLAVLAMAAVLAVFLEGCKSVAGVLDKSVPMKKIAVVDSPYGFFIDGKPVNATGDVIAAAGSHKITRIADIKITVGTQTTSDRTYSDSADGKGGKTTYTTVTTTTTRSYVSYEEYGILETTFEPGKTYTLRYTDTKPFIRAYRMDNGYVLLITDEGIKKGITIDYENNKHIVYAPITAREKIPAGYVAAGGNTYIGGEFSMSIVPVGWKYQNTLALLDLGARYGFSIINDKLDMGIYGETGASVLNVAFNGGGLENLGNYFGYNNWHTGGEIDFFFKKGGIGLGGGIAGLFSIWGLEPNYITPFVQGVIYFQGRDPYDGGQHMGLFVDYYFNSPVWHSSLGIGMKVVLAD